MKLHTLKPAEGSTHSRRRIGRGPGSGLGGTSTRGHKGAKARSGYKKKIGFEGGQMPLQRRRTSTTRSTSLSTCQPFRSLLSRRTSPRLELQTSWLLV